MRGRLLIMFTVLAAICMSLLAVGIGAELAASRTRGMMIERIEDANHFAALSVGDPVTLNEAARDYRSRTDNGVLVIDAGGTVVCDVGVDRRDPMVASVIERSQRFESPPLSLPRSLLPWSPNVFLVAEPLGAPPRARGIVIIAVSTAATRGAIADGWIQLACLTATALLIFGGLALVLSGWILRPVSELLRKVGTLTATLPAPEGRPPRPRTKDSGPPEIRELADAVEAMTSAVAEMAAIERRHVADTAHSMRNPLAALAARLETLRPQIAGGGPVESTFDSIVVEVDRLTALLDVLLAGAVAQARKTIEVAAIPEWCDVVRVAVDRVDAWRAAFARADMAVNIEFSVPTAAARVPAETLCQILDVALSNSSRYAGAGTHATVSVHVESDSVVVSVRDTGIGVPQDEIDLLTTRFFRGAAAAPGGSGLGLPIAATLAAKQGGLFFIDSADPHGLIVTVSFPAVADGMEPTSGVSSR
ncbi:HAMP domain-containing histidine kinase [Nocardia sp. NEAU-G5]|uniref:histidine kinase n=1 Tax=Nocardia albiluteola TaxID=2842303 RepID=A0ABS6B3J4_9NOCA|nr:HAMP domain-containing sensor histidine kinase [Nocardia albiluteola]MBU3064866.1 HAMP domain-containing histidine kinase [Nocardia albiluteola]